MSKIVSSSAPSIKLSKELTPEHSPKSGRREHYPDEYMAVHLLQPIQHVALSGLAMRDRL